MKRFAVFGVGYNPRIPTCYVYATGKEEALELAREKLDGRTFVEHIEERP